MKTCTKAWLETNKIYFETVMAACVAIAAVVVSIAQTYLATHTANIQSALLENQNRILTTQAVLAETARRSDDARIVDELIKEAAAFVDDKKRQHKQEMQEKMEFKALERILMPDSLHARIVLASRVLEPYQRLELPSARTIAAQDISGLTRKELMWSPLSSPEKARLLQALAFLDVSLVGPWGLHGIDGTFADFRQCRLAGVDFSKLDLRESTFRAANLFAANLAGADCRNADFVNADLRGAILSHAKLGNADLTGAYIGGVFTTKGWLAGASKGPGRPRGVKWEHWTERALTDDEAANEYSRYFLISGKDRRSLFKSQETVVVELKKGLDSRKLYPAVDARFREN